MTEVPAHLLGDVSVPVSEDKLEKARNLARRLFEIDDRIEKLDAERETLSKERVELQHRTIPEFFASISIDNIGLPDVEADVVVSPYYKASIAADWEEERRNEAFKALDLNEGGALIRATVTMVFAKEEFEEAKEYMDFVRTQWPKANSHMMELSMTVPWNSLTSWMRGEHEAGRTLLAEDKETILPWSVIGGEVGNIGKVKKRKK